MRSRRILSAALSFCHLGYIDGLSCPSGEHQYSCSSCVSFVTDVLLNYTDAREMCRSRKADLVNVENARQAEIIRRFLESFSERRSVWIGQYYRNNTACYTASSNAGNWTQTPCTVQRPFICARTYGPGENGLNNVHTRLVAYTLIFSIL